MYEEFIMVIKLMVNNKQQYQVQSWVYTVESGI